MMRALGIVGAAVMILLFAALTIVIMPAIQLQATQPPEGLDPYTEREALGRDVYIGLGCVYCHSQQPRDASIAPDGQRGWGRPSVPADYRYDAPHLLGTMRTGPDLFNIGARQPSVDWHLAHLYNPRAVSPGSIMPAYPFLFEEKLRPLPTDTVVTLPAEYTPENRTVVATPKALLLVDYLLALDHTYPVDALPVVEAGE